MIPYKSLATILKSYYTFNFYLLQICIRPENTIRYLQGWFQSPQKLRFQILNTQNLAYITLWIKTYIILHVFCLDIELEIELDWLKDGI